MSRFTQLESFVAVATLGTLSAAARQANIAPAMMGRRIDALEERLGVKLIIRSTRKLSLTPEGHIFLEEAQRILKDLADTESLITEGKVKVSGPLRITAPAGFGRKHVAPLIPVFCEQYPDVKVSLDLTDRVVDLVEEQYDCAIRIGDLENSQLIAIRLAENHRVVVAAPEYLKTHGTPQHPDELQHHECLSFGSQGNQHKGWLFKENDQIIAIKPKARLSCSDGSVLLEWTLSGFGLSWRSMWEVRREIEKGTLVTILDEYNAPANGIYAMLPDRKHLPQRTRGFINLLKNTYAQKKYWK
ncbi:LysR family transcriptional regulator [Advenella alkanexedens]|jgi:DNA-binding transcriptional LysR family regulator|uniref:LysR family transcriptional regulator n=1 Tax=Advenella alkanexedens TaxID=1481665 RepID=A0ABS6NJM6_9BURK|nr:MULTISPECIES: LysR family transcriptional regulator [Advenella]MBV4395838.1 LysR family transcriptional regulator [Advenella alkanexedens]MDD3757372.1 LysR family transcriptional regulator [Advenella sp.]NLN68353.1 LysR family transcriptional regulator [Alcaligenaceae bacterium]WKU18697.1 LysR family transcriptional regulator [Advenella alkanexedens]